MWLGSGEGVGLVEPKGEAGVGVLVPGPIWPGQSPSIHTEVRAWKGKRWPQLDSQLLSQSFEARGGGSEIKV